jgi:dienelactone hydrolase
MFRYIPGFLAALILAALALAPAASAKVMEQAVDYTHDGVALQGFLAFDDATPGPRPAVAIFHDWRGLGDQPKETARRLAALGYLAFAPDMYGKGVLAKDNAEAAKLAGALKPVDNRTLMRRRAAEGLRQLLTNPLADQGKVAAMGYCFGGGVALELARSGAPLAGVISVHGTLATPSPAAPGAIKAPVLALHGADDPFVKPAEVAAFMDEMNTAGADWQFVYFSGAVHAFTSKYAGNDKSKGAAYDERADRRAWQYTVDFLREVFGR